LSATISPENSDRYPDFLTGLTALTHNLTRLLQKKLGPWGDVILLQTASVPQMTPETTRLSGIAT